LIAVKVIDEAKKTDCGKDPASMDPILAGFTFDFELDKPAPCDGYIVQRIEIEETIAKCKECPDRGLPKVRKAKPDDEFYEAWHITKGAVLDDKRVDGTYTYMDARVRKMDDATCGTRISFGTVKFFCEDPKLGGGVGTGDLSKDKDWGIGKAPGSGTLLSTKDKPGWWDMKAIESAAMSVQVGIWWNCCACEEAGSSSGHNIPQMKK
jgi:hypothetical protein